MINVVRKEGSCPYCGHNNFVVSHIQHDLYYVNSLGKIMDSKNLADSAKGLCINCKRVINFLPTTYGFMALSKLGEIIYEDYIVPDDEDLLKSIDNPMQK